MIRLTVVYLIDFLFAVFATFSLIALFSQTSGSTIEKEARDTVAELVFLGTPVILLLILLSINFFQENRFKWYAFYVGVYSIALYGLMSLFTNMCVTY